MIGVFILSAVINFLNIGARVFQTHNVVESRYLAAYVTSWAMSIVSAGNIYIVVDYGFIMVLPIGFGGSLGGILSMYIHSKLIKKEI